MGYQAGTQRIESLANKVLAITPSDSIIREATKGIYVGVSGDLAVTTANGEIVTFKNLSSGVIHPISCTKIRATNTTATDILAVY